MSVLDIIKGRFSVRRYTSDPVNEPELETVLEAARWSQSAKNRQEWRLIVVRDEKTRRALAEAAKNQSFVAQAPVVIACCAEGTEYTMTNGQPSYPIDLAIAMENMALTAWELGLGTCWIGAFHEDRAKEILGVPSDNVRVVGLLTLGCPDGEAPPKNRLPLDRIVRYERWS